MSLSREQELQDAFDEFRRRRQELVDLHSRMAEISATATAPRNVVSVTVGQHGQVQDVQFPAQAYRRMAPAELAAAVLDTVAKAQNEARGKVAELMAPMIPPHLDLKGMLEGNVDVDTLLPREPDADGIFRRLAT